MLADSQHSECDADEHAHILHLVRVGKLFELRDWVVSGKPTLIPRNVTIKKSLIYVAVMRGNHSMVSYLWENAVQHEWEIESLLSIVVESETSASTEIAKYVLSQEFAVDDVWAYSVFKTHDLELIRLAMRHGMDPRSPDGYADTPLSAGDTSGILTSD